MATPDAIRFTIEFQNITECPADVAVLKFARKFHGADRAVSEALISSGIQEHSLQPAEGGHELLATRAGIAARRALFLGTVRIGEFDYRSIRQFAARSLAILKEEAPQTRTNAMTIHGVGRGLDETECALAQLRGILLAIKLNTYPPALEKIVICERNRKRILRIQDRLSKHLANEGLELPRSKAGSWGLDIDRPATEARPAAAGPEPAARPAIQSPATPQISLESEHVDKPHAFIAMPFRPEFDDIFFYGIQNPVHQSGLLCERVDQSAFTGDVLGYIRHRIDTAKVLIAELSDASANVYLEVGYAWGRGVPTILLTQNADALKFDVRNQRCLVYQRIQDLEEILARELSELRLG